MKLIDKYKAIRKIGTEVEVPYEVKVILGNSSSIEIIGSQVCLSKDTDYASIEDARHAAEWYVNQLGGKVKWSK